jgi:hypothetical protein
MTVLFFLVWGKKILCGCVLNGYKKKAPQQQVAGQGLIYSDGIILFITV